jgi:aromatic ring-opening dioxygenase LigB subunit
MIIFACFSPHPPLLLPGVGSAQDRKKVEKTIASLAALGRKLKEIDPQTIVITSPHPDWGFDVPLHFLAPDLKTEVITRLTDLGTPQDHYDEGKKFYSARLRKIQSRVALIASGDLSHRLKTDGPYGFHEQGPAFDTSLVDGLKHRDIKAILGLDESYPEAGECGLRSFCFLLGILEAAEISWKAEILSYEGPFGVGYLVAGFMLKQT